MNIIYQGGANYESFQQELFINCLNELSGDKFSMLELGSNDCSYSIIFNEKFKDRHPINICVEMSRNLLELGISNVGSCDLKGFHFKHSKIGDIDMEYVGQYPADLWGDIADESITLSDIFKEYKLSNLNIIHMDIQGSEIFLVDDLLKHDIDYVFINTHVDSCFGDTYQTIMDKLIDVSNIEFIYNDKSSGGYGDGLIVYKKI